MSVAEDVKNAMMERAFSREEIVMARRDRGQRPSHVTGTPVSASTYKNYGCRCNDCTDAWSTYCANRTAGGRPRRPRRPKPLQQVRRAETNRRILRARYAAFRALADLHPDEFAALHALAIKHVNAEAGPLPGDDA